MINAILKRAVLGSAAVLSVLTGPAWSAESFVDHFNSLSQTRWFISDGWTNGDHQNCVWSRDHVKLQGGFLNITLTDRARNDRKFSCGEIQSNEAFGYGTYEARMRIPVGSGINSNFFSHIGAPQKQPHHEIDFEFLGRLPETVQLNYYVDGVGKHESIDPAPGAHTGYERYAFVWEPDRIAWYIGHTLVREEKSPPLPSLPQKIYFSVWATDTLIDWMGRFAYEGPYEMSVDWVAFTAAGDFCQFPDSIVCELKQK
ncbi:family 16 glycosylhydrolase [Chthonobacter rhizosphaerae]|uniref:family 16 glycosylhydrolase n=1 Tax=Chthonobacter rhizosphaerae TaxID=2735553 RepID=UPI0015EF77F9|nr:family 16 glycosylhydrolase [Chthonobacter rhizosphaerae]